MDLRIEWHDAEAQGYSDILSGDLFASDGETRGASHLVIGPRGGKHVAKCDLAVAGREVTLDYHRLQDEEEWYLGVMRLTFENSSRSGLPAAIEWKPKGSTTFTAADVTVTWAVGPINAIPIFGSDGEPIHSHFSIESDGARMRVTLESRGGTIGSANERNRGYSIGLRLILERLSAARCRLEEALLASKPPSKSVGNRQVDPSGFNLPIDLSPLVDEAHLARALQRALGDVGSNRTQGSGNTTRRLQLVVIPTADMTMAGLALILAGRSIERSISAGDVEDASATLDFDPADEADARRRILTAIARRHGQRQFRNSLKVAYSNACAVTSCSVVQVLEAAHIKAFKGAHTNHVQNGLLLRADIHTLFDMGLVGIDPDTWRVVLHMSMRSGPYGKWHGSKMNLPAKPAQRPNETALREHLNQHELTS